MRPFALSTLLLITVHGPLPSSSVSSSDCRSLWTSAATELHREEARHCPLQLIALHAHTHAHTRARLCVHTCIGNLEHQGSIHLRILCIRVCTSHGEMDQNTIHYNFRAVCVCVGGVIICIHMSVWEHAHTWDHYVCTLLTGICRELWVGGIFA